MRIPVKERLRQWMRDWMGVTEAVNVHQKLVDEQDAVIHGLRKDMDAVIQQLNRTSLGAAELGKRLLYYEKHSAIIAGLKEKYDKDERTKREAKRREEEARQHLPPGALDPPVAQVAS